ncbi:hypothetical protein RCJ22_14355, partial [Vibrio sp. FNV 38]|nr:hypothetical protein [Vibrio sp. FNV 38]
MLGFRVRKFPNIKNVEIKTLVILFFFIFLVNTPVNYIKKNALKDIEEKVRISELSLVANFDVLQSYINLSDSLIASDFSNNLLYFNDLMSHMTSEHPFINSVDIYIPINSDRTAEHFWQNTIEVTQFDQVLTVNKPIVNEGKVVGELSISVEIESFMSHFYDGMLIMSERGFVFWSNYEDIESLSQVNFEYIEVLNQIQRVSRPNGTVDLGSYTFLFKKTNEIFGEPAYVVYLIDNSDIVPTYISVTFVLVALLLIITNFSISENRKKRELEEIS